MTMGNNHREAEYARARLDLIADVEALLGGGTSVDELLIRLNVKRKALVNRLERSGRLDLAKKVRRKVAC